MVAPFWSFEKGCHLNYFVLLGTEKSRCSAVVLLNIEYRFCPSPVQKWAPLRHWGNPTKGWHWHHRPASPTLKRWRISARRSPILRIKCTHNYMYANHSHRHLLAVKNEPRQYTYNTTVLLGPINLGHGNTSSGFRSRGLPLAVPAHGQCEMT